MKHMKISMTEARDFYQEKYQLPDEFFDQYKLRRVEQERVTCRPYEGITELCRLIHESGRKNYLYTHRSGTALIYLRDHGLYNYFTDFITSQDGFNRKPSPDAILHLIDKHEMKLEEAMMVGDRELDILSAKNAGITACFFAEDDVDCAFADYIVSSAGEIYPLL
jgi:HAD superfamily hydrolase (TIGR01549 family)